MGGGDARPRWVGEALATSSFILPYYSWGVFLSRFCTSGGWGKCPFLYFRGRDVVCLLPRALCIKQPTCLRVAGLSQPLHPTVPHSLRGPSFGDSPELKGTQRSTSNPPAASKTQLPSS